jgi:hypothetical protein
MKGMTDLGERGYLLITITVEILLRIVDSCRVVGTESVHNSFVMIQRHSLMPPLMPLGKALFCIMGTRL